MPDDKNFPFDFSKFEIDTFDARAASEEFQSVMEQVAKEIGKAIDVKIVKEAFRKAAEYDRSYNQVTVELHAREEEVRKFAGWLFHRIHTNAMTREEIIKELEEYAGNEA